MNADDLIKELTQAISEHIIAKYSWEGAVDNIDTRLHKRAERALSLYKQNIRRQSEKTANLANHTQSGPTEFAKRARAMKEGQPND